MIFLRFLSLILDNNAIFCNLLFCYSRRRRKNVGSFKQTLSFQDVGNIIPLVTEIYSVILIWPCILHLNQSIMSLTWWCLVKRNLTILLYTCFSIFLGKLTLQNLARNSCNEVPYTCKIFLLLRTFSLLIRCYQGNRRNGDCARKLAISVKLCLKFDWVAMHAG